MAKGDGRRLRRWANDPLPGEAANTNIVDAARRGLDTNAGLGQRDYYGDRAAMGGALQGLQGLADGTGPSLAQTQLQNQADTNIAATMAAMGSARSGNLNAAQMGAATAGVGIQQDTNKAAAEIRAKEQIDALNASGNLAGAMAGLSSDRELNYAGMSQDATMQQYATQNERELARAGAINDRLNARNEQRREWSKFGLNAGGQVIGSVVKAVSDERMKKDVRSASARSVQVAHREKEGGGLLSGLLSDERMKCRVGGSSISEALASMGDGCPCGEGEECSICGEKHGAKLPVVDYEFDAKERAWANRISRAHENADEEEDDDDGIDVLLAFFGSPEKHEAAKTMGHVEPVSFRYKDEAVAEGMPRGRVTGIMAQDLERAGPMGRAAVEDGEDGIKRLDGIKSLSLALAAAADHEDRLKNLEQQMKGKGW